MNVEYVSIPEEASVTVAEMKQTVLMELIS
jgi:hypothetical protein